MTNKHKHLIPSIVNKLRESGEDFELLSIQETAANAEWIENNFPISLTFHFLIDV